MRKNILITGQPKSGKSFLLEKMINLIPHKVGFVTHEILQDGKRMGFEIEDHMGTKSAFAHVDFKTNQKVGRFFVDLKNLDNVLSRMSVFTKDDLLYVDEIGEMQVASPKFRNTVSTFFDSQNICIATISSVYEDDFIRAIKTRGNLIHVHVSIENRDQMFVLVTQILNKIRKAQKYLSEPDRFTVYDSLIILKSEHDKRTLSLEDNMWKCNCDFFKKYLICSHSMAVEEFVNYRSHLV